MGYNKYTTIRISKVLREALNNLGKKNETYEDIILKIIKENNMLDDSVVGVSSHVSKGSEL